MRMPGFVAEASLVESKMPDVRMGGTYTFRPSHFTRRTVTAQQRLRVEKQPRFFFTKCQQSCAADQQRARYQCLGRCFNYLGAGSPLVGSCISSCSAGEDFYREPGIEVESNILRAPAELKPGYCDYRCLSPRLTPVRFGA